MRTAEEYLLARFNLYLQVYLHKTTRAAEQMLQTTLIRFSELLRDGNVESSGLSPRDNLVTYFGGDRSLEAYLALDDTAVWSGLNAMASSEDEILQRLAGGLRDRKLYKCFDAGAKALERGGDSLQRFLRLLTNFEDRLMFGNGLMALHDEAPVTLYGSHGFDESGALQKVLIEPSQGEQIKDIAEVSRVLQSIESHRLYRIYAPTDAGKDTITQLWEEANP